MKRIELPSGRFLEVDPAPFKEAKKLYQAMGGELLRVEINGEHDIANLIKNILCLGFSSPAIEAALEPCLKRCAYGTGDHLPGIKLPETFEPVEAREDYLDICVEVAKENISPFTKSLFAQFKGLSGALSMALPSRSSTTQMGSSSTSDSVTPGTGA